MDMVAVEKITFIAALVVAVVYLWRAYAAARDETIATLKAELERMEKENAENEK